MPSLGCRTRLLQRLVSVFYWLVWRHLNSNSGHFRFITALPVPHILCLSRERSSPIYSSSSCIRFSQSQRPCLVNESKDIHIRVICICIHCHYHYLVITTTTYRVLSSRLAMTFHHRPSSIGRAHLGLTPERCRRHSDTQTLAGNNMIKANLPEAQASTTT